eukprot:TRINITY_DN2901_c1_g1_i1.p1 TRINITY_DN2901_c1_g1~~TRINITY_DN2901_c1_g1_i1.p1  ORF type:complete len:462 (-),score=137.30 TRINITY_DN2901_c1_g1_i1:472-1857(-)
MNSQSFICPNCGSTTLSQVEQKGMTCCANCGEVIDENVVVNELQFIESGGSTSTSGQFISSTSSSGTSSHGKGFLFNSKSRDITIAKAKHRIQDIAQNFGLGQHVVEAAQRFYMLALSNGFCRGRRAEHVYAVCLYTVCRREKKPFMLIDFSSHLRVNLYVLGNCFVKFVQQLHLDMPIVDPSLYIHRFAAQLNFGKETGMIANAALKLVAEMKRNWLHMGRRPSGVCGAALFVASRMYGYNRTYEEITRIVKIASTTLHKRTLEFTELPSSSMTGEQLEDGKLELAEQLTHPTFRKHMAKVLEEFDAIMEGTNTTELLDVEERLLQEIQAAEFANEPEDLSYYDQEIASMIYSKEEVQLNAQVFNQLYGEWYEEHLEKLKERDKEQKASKARKSKEGIDLLKSRVSSRINMDKLSELFGEHGDSIEPEEIIGSTEESQFLHELISAEEEEELEMELERFL